MKKRFVSILLLFSVVMGLLAGCGVAPTETTAPTEVLAKEEAVLESGDKIIFIGNSFTYYGKCVLDKGQKEFGLDKRANDQGYFYQICKANGLDVSVTNFTFGGHQLKDFYSGKCAAGRGHDGLNHLEYLTDRDYDYVVLQQGSGGKSAADILGECRPLMDLFLKVNPNTQFVFLVHHRVHQVEETAYKSHIKELEDAGFIVVDWGALVADVINGTTQVPGATQTYDNNSFVISKSMDDGFHENLLAGYITAQMTYCALTGQSAVGQDYSFCGDKRIHSSFDFETFKAMQYLYDTHTNFIEIFGSEADMKGLQQLIDKYLAEKAYRNY